MVNKLRTLLNEAKTLFLNDHFLQFLLIADLFYIVMSILHLIPSAVTPITVLKDQALDIGVDRGIGEGFRYSEELWTAVALFIVMVRRRNWAYLGWALWFFYFLLDDMLQIHEALGGLAARLLFSSIAIPASFKHLRPQDFGELTVAITLGVVFVATIALTYIRARQDIRKEFNILLLLLVGFFAFAAGVDFLDRLFNPRIISVTLSLVENGGQMLVLSAIAWYATSLVKMSDPSKGVALPT